MPITKPSSLKVTSFPKRLVIRAGGAGCTVILWCQPLQGDRLIDTSAHCHYPGRYQATNQVESAIQGLTRFGTPASLTSQSGNCADLRTSVAINVKLVF